MFIHIYIRLCIHHTLHICIGMSVDELKSELDMRGVKYDDCISKNELVDRLISTRLVGTANVDILEQFNR
jgi:hypothetical protein